MSGWKVNRIIITSLTPRLKNEDAPDGHRPDQLYQLPTRSWSVREWERKINDDPGVPGLIPLEEIFPRVAWMNLEEELPEILEMANSGHSLDVSLLR